MSESLSGPDGIIPTPTDMESSFARCVELEVDEGAGTLGPSAPKTITEAEKRVLLEQTRAWRISADVTTLAHGTYGDDPATLILFYFRVSYKPYNKNRVAMAEITLNFQPAQGDKEFPVVEKFAPGSIHTDTATVPLEKDVRFGLSTKLGVAMVPGIDIAADRRVKTSYTREYRCELTGDIWTSDEAGEKGLKIDNALTWCVKENKLHRKGIPKEIRTLAVIRRTRPSVNAVIKVRVKTNWGAFLSGILWPKASELVIQDSETFGNSPPVTNFKTMSQKQLDALVGFGQAAEEVEAENGGRIPELQEHNEFA